MNILTYITPSLLSNWSPTSPCFRSGNALAIIIRALLTSLKNHFLPRSFCYLISSGPVQALRWSFGCKPRLRVANNKNSFRSCCCFPTCSCWFYRCQQGWLDNSIFRLDFSSGEPHSYRRQFGLQQQVQVQWMKKALKRVVNNNNRRKKTKLRSSRSWKYGMLKWSFRWVIRGTFESNQLSLRDPYLKPNPDTFRCSQFHFHSSLPVTFHSPYIYNMHKREYGIRSSALNSKLPFLISCTRCICESKQTTTLHSNNCH